MPEVVEFDQPPLTDAEDAAVDEDDLSWGTDGSDSTTDTGALHLDGTILATVTVDWGADGSTSGEQTTDVDFTFDDLTDVTIDHPTGLTSNGLDVQYDDVTTDGAGNYVLQAYVIVDAGLATEHREEVFTVTVDADGSDYSFELQRNLDHADAGGENTLDLSFTLNGEFDLAAKFDGTDYDLDPSGLSDSLTFQGQSFTVTVTDDVPEAADAVEYSRLSALSSDVDEDDLSWGTDGSDSLTTGNTLGLAAPWPMSTSIGGPTRRPTAPPKPPAVDLDFSDLTDVTITGPSGLTSNGMTVQYDDVTTDASGNYILQAYVIVDEGLATEHREEVFTVTVEADGTDYSFELQRNLDHADGNGENDLDLSFSLDGTFDVSGALSGTDYDLDATADGLTADFTAQTFTVTVVDDVPEAGAAVEYARVSALSSDVDEDDLSWGTDGSDSLTTGNTLGLGGALAYVDVDWGADKAADGTTETTRVDLDFSDLTDVTITGPSGLTSNGLDVRYDDVTTDGAGNYILQAYVIVDEGLATEHREEVFTVTVEADGTDYSFELQRNLDHADGNGENDLDLSFTLDGTFDVSGALSGTDYDLDTATDGLTADFSGQSFTVTVVDDVPEAGAATQRPWKMRPPARWTKTIWPGAPTPPRKA